MTTRLLTAKETANVLRVSEARVYELARTGRLPVVRLGRQVRIDEQRLGALIAAGGWCLDGGWKNERDGVRSKKQTDDRGTLGDPTTGHNQRLYQRQAGKHSNGARAHGQEQ